MLGPNFLMASVYHMMPQLAAVFGKEALLVTPIAYWLWFKFCTTVAVALQAVGAGMSDGYSVYRTRGRDTAIQLAIAGLSLQFAFMVLYALFAVDIIRRIQHRREKYGEATFGREYLEIRKHPKLKLLVCAIAACFVCIFIRTVIRLAGLVQGMDGVIMMREGFQLGLDALPVFLGSVCLTLVHPGFILGTVRVKLRPRQVPAPKAVDDDVC